MSYPAPVSPPLLPGRRGNPATLITAEKIRTYAAFAGDADAWARQPARRRADMTDADWRSIDELLSGLVSAGTGLASAAFRQRIEALLMGEVADEAAREALRELAMRSGAR